MKERLMASFTREGYQDVRYEELQKTNILYVGKKLKDISISKKAGGHARGFYQGGFGHLSFTDLNELENAVKVALQQAKLVSEYRGESYELAKVPVVVDEIKANPSIDPRVKSLEEKRALLNKYNELALSVEGVTTTETNYVEQASHKYFTSNEGTYIDHEQLYCGITLRIYASRGRNTQRASVSLGGSEDFALLLNGEEEVLEAAKRAVALLDAKPVEAGNYAVVLNPEAAGVFIHEAFGHLSEADGVAGSASLQETMKLGRVFGKPVLNVIDDGSLPGNPGSIAYDDDGVKAEKTYLIKDGILTGRLHSRETAGRMGEPLSGNSRAMDFSFLPICRMSNIYIDRGQSSFLEMISSIEDGLYLCGAAGGQTSGNTFTLAVQYGYRIRNGQIAELVRDIVLNCNLFETLANISAVGDDLRFARSGGCGKAGQILVTSGMGAPHIKIDSITIGGK